MQKIYELYKKIGINNDINIDILNETFYGRLTTEEYNRVVINFNKKNNGIDAIYNKKCNINIANIMKIGDIIYAISGPPPISSDGEYRTTISELVAIGNYIEAAKIKYNEFVDPYIKLYERYIEFPDYINFFQVKYIIYWLLNNMSLLSDNKYPKNYSELYYKHFIPFTKHLIPDKRLSLFIFMDNNKVLLIRPIGCKIIPLYINDIKHLNKLTQNFQREKYIGGKLLSILRNGVNELIPMTYTGGLFKIKNLEIFNNDEIKKLYKMSENTLESLKYLYMSNQIYDNLETIKTYRQKIQIPILYAEKKIILSNYCYILLNEYLGNTLADKMMKNIESKEKIDKNKDIINGYQCIKTIIFEVLYSLLVNCDKIGIIHCDLHLNNIIIKDSKNNNAGGVFIINGVNYFVNINYIVYIIDYGRSYILPDILRREFDDFDDILEYQNKKILDYINRLMPEFYEANIKDLNYIIKNINEQTFKLLICLDIIYFLSVYRVIITEFSTEVIVNFIYKLEIEVINYFKLGVYNITNNKEIPKTNIIIDLIEKYFAEYKNNPNRVVNIYCNYDNEIKIKNEELIILKNKIKNSTKYEEKQNINVYKLEKEFFKKKGINI